MMSVTVETIFYFIAFFIYFSHQSSDFIATKRTWMNTYVYEHTYVYGFW
jgi:hypothetical protein